MFFLGAFFLTFLLPTTHAQTITPAPISALSPRKPCPAAEQQAISDSLSGAEDCDLSDPGCSGQITLFNECTSSYGTSFIYLYCLCTNGYYDAKHSCDACEVKAGLYSTDFLSTELSLDNAECASLSYEFGGPGTIPLTGFDGVTFGDGSGGATIPKTVTTSESRTDCSGKGCTTTISTSSSTTPELPTATFALTLDGSPTGTLPSIQSSPTTQASSASLSVKFCIKTLVLTAISCLLALDVF